MDYVLAVDIKFVLVKEKINNKMERCQSLVYWDSLENC